MAKRQGDLEQRMAALRVSFAESLVERLAGLDAAVDQLDVAENWEKAGPALTEVRGITHRLAGSGTTFGFPEISRIARDLEVLSEALNSSETLPKPEDRESIHAMAAALHESAEKGPIPEDAGEDGIAEVASAAPSDGSQQKRVLLVEDDRVQARGVIASLKGQPYEIEHVETGAGGMAAIEKNLPDAILLDLMLPDMEGIEILRSVSERQLPCTVIVVTAHGSVNLAVEAMRLGAYDFIMKPFSAARLHVTLRNALDHSSLSRIVETYKDLDRTSYFGFVGASLPMQAVYRIIDSAAGSKATVFISGESGTGKEVCAEAIHCKSPRGKRSFVAINCGAIPKDLMESEIFGHVKGAFTGAIAEREGAAQRADGGTLFLDEICEMDLSLQTKLLRFVQAGTFQKVGGEKTEAVDVRFVCATNRDPMTEVAAGRFREDLFYRLHVIPIQLPPLRERDDDVILIAQQFLVQFAREEGKHFTKLSAAAEAALQDYAWPGNVREMQNVLRNVIVLNDGDEITEDMLPPALVGKGTGSGARTMVTAPIMPSPPPVKRPNGVVAPEVSSNSDFVGTGAKIIRPLADVEREAIDHAIRICEGNIPKAAHFLGVSASTIYRKKQTWEEATENGG